MNIAIQQGWSDYSLLDSGNGMRLERFGRYTISRPDPQALWLPHLSQTEWKKVDAEYTKSTEGKGRWKVFTAVPEKWLLHYKNLSFFAKLTPFKHTGIFPEQAAQWDWIAHKISSAHRPISMLNLFAYTGIASVAAVQASAKVTHVDASRPSIGWARENQEATRLPKDSIRWILDDANKFTRREIKRGVRYDAIMLDPPVYGHGPQKEPWDFQKDIFLLLRQCRTLLSAQPLFVIINAYAVSSSSIMLNNMLQDMMKDHKGIIEYGELALREANRDRILSTGIYAAWSSHN